MFEGTSAETNGSTDAARRLAGAPDATRFLVERHMSLAHINLRGNPSDPKFYNRAQDVLGLPLPVIPNTVSSTADLTACWLAPTEWLLTLPEAREHALSSALRAALQGQSVSIVEISGGQVVLHLSGSCVREVLAKGCPLDLHERAFATGQCAQSLLAKAPVLLRATARGVEIVVRQSFATYLLQWLQVVTLEFAWEKTS